jgi:imidazole glycerol phosphate synthase glutamine amidotransferase subunit
MIAIIDYQAGNLRSVQKALAYLGAEYRTVDQPGGLEGGDKILLPGVGNFGAAMDHLDRSGLAAAIRDWLKADRPFLGICLGMQMLFETSEEDPGRAGFGFFPGSCRQFKSGKVPQIGWNDVRPMKKSALLNGFSGNPYFYFLHSFYAVPEDRSIVSGITNYGLDYPSVVEQGQVCGVQFHPEKSGDRGIEMLLNWVRRA